MNDADAARVAEMAACVIVGFLLAVLAAPPGGPPRRPPPDPFDSYPDWPEGEP